MVMRHFAPGSGVVFVVFQYEIAEGGLFRGKIFLFAYKIQVMGHGTFQREGQQLAVGYHFTYGNFRKHGDAHACGDQMLDGFGIIDGSRNVQLGIGYILLYPAQEFLLQGGSTAAGDQRLAAEEFCGACATFKFAEALFIGRDYHQAGGCIVLYRIIRIHNLHVAEGELEAACAKLVGYFGIIANGDIEADVGIHFFKIHDAGGQAYALTALCISLEEIHIQRMSAS